MIQSLFQSVLFRFFVGLALLTSLAGHAIAGAPAQALANPSAPRAAELPTAVPSGGAPQTQPPDSNPVIYKETFNPPPTNWNTGSTDNDFMTVNTKITSAGYQWDLKAKQDAVNEEFSVPPITLPDQAFLFGAAIQVVNGPSNTAYGLMFREQDTQNFYYFEVEQDGFYSVVALVNNKWSTLVPKTPTKDLHLLSNDYDLLAVSGLGSTYTFFINNKQETSVTDTQFTAGNIGLGAELFNKDDTATVLIHDITVCNASCDLSPSQPVAAASTQPPMPPLPSETPGFQSPSMTQAPLPTVSSTVIYQENFTQTPANWDTGATDNDYMTIKTQFANGGYQWDLKAKQAAVNEEFSVPNIPLPDSYFIYGATVQVANGPSDAAFGLLFREQDTKNFYFFEVMQNGFYDVVALVNDQWVTLIPKTATQDLHLLSKDYDKLDVLGQGNSYQFYINNKLENSVNDTHFTGGNIGLAAELFTAGDNSTVVFNNLIVCSAQC